MITGADPLFRRIVCSGNLKIPQGNVYIEVAFAYMLLNICSHK